LTVMFPQEGQTIRHFGFLFHLPRAKIRPGSKAQPRPA
jgi:hypothetical protein